MSAALPATAEVSAAIGEPLETLGTATVVTGYFLAPVTEGASLVLVPVGVAAERTGVVMQAPKKILEGDYKSVAYDVGSGLLFDRLGSTLDSFATVYKS